MVEVDGNRLNLSMVMGNRLVVGSVNAGRAHFDQAVRYLDQIESRWPGLLARMITRAVPIEAFQQALAPDPNGIKSVVEMGDADAAV
jgi:hypothetical protein